MFLSGVDDKYVRAAAQRYGFGLLVTPNRNHRERWRNVPEYPFWAADSDCYANGDGFDPVAYLEWLGNLMPWRSHCLFVTAPDVMLDADATWKRSLPVLCALVGYRFARALVAQDGFDPRRVQWDCFEWLFIGGSTEFKVSADKLVRIAQAEGKRVHMGRVNSLRRLLVARRMGCHSVDGTLLRRRDKYLARLVNWLGHANAQGVLL